MSTDMFMHTWKAGLILNIIHLMLPLHIAFGLTANLRFKSSDIQTISWILGLPLTHWETFDVVVYTLHALVTYLWIDFFYIKQVFRGTFICNVLWDCKINNLKLSECLKSCLTRSGLIWSSCPSEVQVLLSLSFIKLCKEQKLGQSVL